MAITLALEPRVVPLTRLENGVYRVSGTRIPLQRVVEHHLAGETPEEIVDAYDVLRLADVYAVISYYLDHKEEVDDYIQKVEAEADELERRIRTEMPLRPGFKEELLARWARLNQDHAPAADSCVVIEGEEKP